MDKKAMQPELTRQNLQAKKAGAWFDVSGKLRVSNREKDSLTDVVWVPTQQVLLTQVVVPGKRKSDWMKALPYALEEEISQPIEEVFIAVLHREQTGDNAGLTQVAIVSNERMSQWTETLVSEGLASAQLVPDCFQCPFPEKQNDSSTVYYIETETHRLARTGQWTGMAIPLDWLTLVSFKNITWQKASPAFPMLESLKSFGLRQGHYQPFSKSTTWVKNWGKVFAVFGLLLLLLVVQNWMEAHQKTIEKQQLTEATERLFKQMFPEVKRIVNLTAQAKTALAKQPSESEKVGPAQLAKLVESAFKQVPKVEIKAFEWQNQRLSLSLDSPDNNSLQALSEALKNKVALTLKINSMQPNQVQAEMVIDGIR
ncbi:MAG: hypothetical protein DSZ27_02460 [Thiomicrospira sp.]|nr:MAG: hypothetical protein DSZ27_02460 [Thiomicrospira sp.]